MSVELANEKYLDGDEDGLLGQFASNQGYTSLISAARGYETLSRFFADGATEDVDQVREELEDLAASGPSDVRSTAKALLDLTDGQDCLIITNGGS